MSSRASFEKHVLNKLDSAPKFHPIARFDPDGDCIEFIAKSGSFYAERVDDLVTVYYGHETREIVGSLIKGVTRFLNEFPGHTIDIRDGRIRIVHLFRASAWRSSDDPQAMRTRVYEKLIDVAEESEVEAEMCLT